MDNRHNDGYGGAGRSSALRNSRSPPRKEHRVTIARTNSRGKPTSPLRSKNQPQFPESHQVSKQQSQMEDYERGRQSTLQQKLEEKERELHSLQSLKSKGQNPRDRLRGTVGGQPPMGSASSNSTLGRQVNSHRSGKASGINYTASAQAAQQKVKQRGSNSPLRSRDGSQGVNYNTSKNIRQNVRGGSVTGYSNNTRHHQDAPVRDLNASSSRTITPRPQLVPKIENYMRKQQKNSKSPSALRHKHQLGSRSPNRDIDMRDASYGLLTGPQQRITTINPVHSATNEYLSQLAIDNDSLQSRLNLVLIELDRINRNRSDLTIKMSMVERDVGSMQDKLNMEDEADMMNNGLQVDVNGQRDNNVGIKQAISDTDMMRTDAIQKLRVYQGDRDRRCHMTEELKDDLQNKLEICKQLEQEQYLANEQMNELETQISSLKREALEDEPQIDEVHHIITKLSGERDELQIKLEHLNRTYDGCVSEISIEKAKMSSHNRHHNKLLVAKVTFTALEKMFQRRKQEALNEFIHYCKFDEKCHNTLGQFIRTVDRLGKYRLRIAIKQWHQRTFKPMEVKIQEQELLDKFMRRKNLQKIFNAWRFHKMNAAIQNGARNKALQTIWDIKTKDCSKDMQRAFSIWRDNVNYQKLRGQRCKKIVWRQYSNKLAQAWQTWVNHIKNLESQMRLHVLAKCFAENQLKRINFNEMKFVLFEMRRKRLNRLRMYLKAWKESNQYNKFLLQSNMMVLGFKKEGNKSLLKTCFDALRIAKEEEKMMLMQECLEGDCAPAIESLNKSIEKKTQKAVRSGRNRGLDSIKGMIYRQVAEYFNKWKSVQQRQAVMIGSNLKSMVIKRFQQSIRDAFNLWKLGKANKEIVMQSGMIMEMQEEGSSMAAEVESLGKQIEIKKKEVDRSGRSSLNRGTNIMKKRYLKQYFDKWSQTNKVVNNQSDGADTILLKMRKRYLRQAFDLYKAGMAREKLSERNEGSCEQIRHTLNIRLMRKCFNGVKAFNDKNETATRYFKIVLGKMDRWMKKRAFATWMDGGNQMKMEMVMDHQNVLTDEMTVKNNELGGVTNKLADKSARNVVLTNNLKSMGSRTMSNAFARAYAKTTSQHFEKWKEWLRCEKHREAVLKRTIEHWLKSTAKKLMAIMLNWKAMSKIGDSKTAISQLDHQMNDMSLVQKGETTEFESQKMALVESTQTTNTEFEKTVVKRSKMMALMTENNQNMDFQGRLRYLFGSWREHTRRQAHFTRCISRVMSKSVWQRGFQNIREFSRDKQMTRSQNSGLAKLRNMYWKRNCAGAFSKWRQTEYVQALEMITMTEENQMQIQGEHVQKKRIIQKQNITRSAKIVGKSQKHKFYQAWKNITRWLKHKRVAKQNFLEAQSSYAIKRSIKKWRARTELTKTCRGVYEKFQMKREYIYKNACFRELMLKHHREKALIQKLSNTASTFDARHLQSAFQMIKNYVRAKQDTQAGEKKMSSRNIGDVLKKIYRRKLLQYYSHMRRQIHGDKVVEKKKKVMFGHFISANMRDAFNRWKKQAVYARTVIDVNEVGPIAEQVLEKQLQVHNLRKLMADEGFTNYQVDDVTNRAHERSNELLAKSIARIKHWNGTDDYLKPKMFDRWRRFVAFRKIMKHWLDFLTNRQEHGKADLSHMFNKWKFFYSDQQNLLQKNTRAQLLQRAVKNSKRLEMLAESTLQDEDMINHLGDQNKELFNNYRKSQKLALALGRDNHKFAMMKGLSNLMDNSSRDKERYLDGCLARNIDAIALTKDKMKELENDNEALANENEELRQFSLDGYQLGKNVTNLTSEREVLSVDLADKAATIKKLLDENERLSRRLNQAKLNAAHLLR